MAARLNTHVWVHQAEGEPVCYGPDDTVPAEHAALITNPDVWAEAPEPDPEPAAPADPEPGPAADTDGPFDPGAHNMPDVLAYLQGLGDDDGAEYERVIAAEKAGKNRKGIVGADGVDD